MKMEEILKNWKIVATRPPRKGERFIAVKNTGGGCEVCKASRNFKTVFLNIVEKRKPFDSK